MTGWTGPIVDIADGVRAVPFRAWPGSVLAVTLVIGLLWLIAPVMALAGTPIEASLDPPRATAGTLVLVDGDPCSSQVGHDVVWFSKDDQGQPPYMALTAPLEHANGSLRSFVVPRLPAGRYTLVAECSDCLGTPCTQFGQWFTVLGAPDTATAPAQRPESNDPPWPLLILAGLVGGGAALRRSRVPLLR